MRVQKTRYKPVHIALEEFDPSVIRIEQPPFLAVEWLGGRKFLASLDGEIFLQENDFGSRLGLSAAPQKKLFCPKLSPETNGPTVRPAFWANQLIREHQGLSIVAARKLLAA